jgi:serine/threonine-protein kinase
MSNQLSSKIIGKNLNGRYRVISALGTGGFGTTYLAEDQHRPGRPRCVVKQLQLNSDNTQLVEVTRRLFNTEAETLQKISHHAQIPELLASFEEKGQFFLVQEFIPGPSLIAEILAGQALPEPRVNKLLKEVLHVLEFVHAQGVVHRNLKADNIIHHEQLDKWVLINFGSEKALKEISNQLMGQKKGAAEKFSPSGYALEKQTISNGPSANLDIYALGMICLQALTGISPSDIERDLKTGEIRWPAEITSRVSPKLRNIISKMVFHDSSQRYSSAAEVLQALNTSPAFPLPKHLNPVQAGQTPEATTQVPRPVTSAFNSSSQGNPFPLPPDNPKTPTPNRPSTPKSRTDPEPSEANSVFAQPVVVDPAASPLPLWISGVGVFTAFIAAGFFLWISIKSDSNNSLVTSKPPAQESTKVQEPPQLNAEQRALLQEANTPTKSQPERKASSQQQLEAKTPVPAIKEEVPVPVPPPPQLKIPAVPALPTQSRAKASTNQSSALNSFTQKQAPTKANLAVPSVKSTVASSTKTEASSANTTTRASESVPTSPKVEAKASPEAKPTESPIAKSTPAPSPVPSKQETPETPTPLPSANKTSESTSSQQPANKNGDRDVVATASPVNSRVDISLVNATGTLVSYQVLGNTDERYLYADMRYNLRGLPAPANVSFYRPDRGPIEIITKTIAPGKIQVTLKRGSGPEDDHSFLTVQDSGKVTLD